jgi:predicted nucleotide-binding protein
MFISDISTINKTDIKSDRKTPNPNVMYELGYAVARLGWEKIILILSEEYGTINDIPFDIRQHAITCYILSDLQKEKQKSIIGNKAKVFEKKINLILDIKPKLKILDNQTTIRLRDIKIIEKIRECNKFCVNT